MRDSKSLEPANGDYVTYLDKLLSGKERNLEPLSITASDGMVKVQSAQEVAADAAAREARVAAWQADRAARNRAAAKKLSVVVGSLIVVMGVLSFVAGILSEELESVCIPLGMITVFAGTVLTGQAKSAARRR